MMPNERGRFECPRCGREFSTRRDAFECRDGHGGISVYDEARSLAGYDAERYR